MQYGPEIVWEYTPTPSDTVQIYDANSNIPQINFTVSPCILIR